MSSSHPTPPRPLALSDEQMDAVFRACAPLTYVDRSRFLLALADRLRHEPELGDGAIYKAIRELQKQHWRPPSETEAAEPRISFRDRGEAIR
jgi:hypothetical protein